MCNASLKHNEYNRNTHSRNLIAQSRVLKEEQTQFLRNLKHIPGACSRARFSKSQKKIKKK